MKRFFYLSGLLLILSSCGHSKKFTLAENSLDALIKFTAFYYSGDEEGAKFYLLKDKENIQQLEQWLKHYAALPNKEKKAYKNSNILITNDTFITKDISLIYFYNSYDKKPMQVKVSFINQKEFLVSLMQ